MDVSPFGIAASVLDLELDPNAIVVFPARLQLLAEIGLSFVGQVLLRNKSEYGSSR